MDSVLSFNSKLQCKEYFLDFTPLYLPTSCKRKVHCSIRLDIGEASLVHLTHVCSVCAVCSRFSWYSGPAINVLAFLASGIKEHASGCLVEPSGY